MALEDGQRINGLGQVVEYNERSGRWEPVKEDVGVETPEVPEETTTPEPTEDEPVVDDVFLPARRTRRTSKVEE